jgi:tetratricopeptide (TPR) repeat protein
MQTPVSSSWFAVLRPCGRIAGLLLVAVASAGWQPWAEAQQGAPKAADLPTTQPTTEPGDEPASTEGLNLDDLLPGEEGKKGSGVDADKSAQLLAEGKALFDEKKYEEAFERLVASQQGVAEDSPEALYYMGRAALELKQLREAGPLLTSAVQAAKTAPDNETGEAPKEYLYYLGRTMVEGGDFENAVKTALTPAIRLDENYADAYHQRGVAFRQLQQVKRAEKDLKKATELDATKKEFFTDLGVLYYMDKEPEKSIEALTKAIELTEAEPTEGKTEEELEQGYPDPYVARGAAYIVLGKQAKTPEAAREAYDHAVVDSEKAIQIRADEGSSYFNLGLALRFLGRYQDAIAAFSKGLERISQESSTFGESYLRRGICWYYLGDYGMAETDFYVGLAVSLDQDARAHFWHGLALAKQGRMAEALQAYDRALALRPDFYDAHYNRALANLALKEYQKAVTSINYYIALRTEEARGFFVRGLAQAYLGQDREALASYTRAIELDPQNAQAYFNRALINERLGRSAEAQRDRGEALRLDPALRSNGATALAPLAG